MGWGDALMAAGQAEEIYAQHPALGPIAMIEGDNLPRWNMIWQGNPAIWIPGTSEMPSRRLQTGKGHLPYIENPYSIETGWRFTSWRASEHRGHLYLTESERVLALQLRQRIGRYILLEPTALRKHPNRRPPRAFWRQLFDQLASSMLQHVVQLEYDGADLLPTPWRVPHVGFREACAILSGAALLITTEGGLAHAAAALGIPAIVLWGGNISADALGYPEHVNIVDPSPETPCGRLIACPHCAAAWAALDPDRIVQLAQAALSPSSGQVA